MYWWGIFLLVCLLFLKLFQKIRFILFQTHVNHISETLGPMPVAKFYSANIIMYLLMILLLILLLSNQVLLSNSRLFLFGGAPGSFISWMNNFYGIFLCWKAFPRKFTFPQLYLQRNILFSAKTKIVSCQAAKNTKNFSNISFVVVPNKLVPSSSVGF